MQPIIKDIGEITDSKELYDSKPHPFLAIFIYILLVSLIGAIIWMYFGEIDIVSKGRGIVRPNESVSKIRSKAEGKIISWNIEEGRKVFAGESLFSIDTESLQVSKLQLENTIADDRKHVQQLEKFYKSIQTGENLFSEENEPEYYTRYIKYVQDIQELMNQEEIDNKCDQLDVEKTQVNQSNYSEQITDYEEDLKEYLEYKISVESEESHFTNEECLSAKAFNIYLLEREKLRDKIEESSSDLEAKQALYDAGALSEKELNTAEQTSKYAESDYNQYKVTTIKSIETNIKELEDKIKQLRHQKDALIIDDNLLNISKKQRALSVKQYETDMIVSIYNQIEELNKVITEQESKLKAIELSISNCNMIAPIDGTLHILENHTEGDLISSGAEVATIIPENDSMYKVEVIVPNSKIVGIKLGDTIKYNFDALPYKEYGQLEGKITNIPTDSQESIELGINGYVVESTLLKGKVYSYKNEEAEVKVGMTCEAYIIIERKKILYVLLEKLNLKE